MRYLDLAASILLIIGGINWGLVGLFDFNLFSFLADTGFDRLVYGLVGLSGLWQAKDFFKDSF